VSYRGKLELTASVSLKDDNFFLRHGGWRKINFFEQRATESAFAYSFLGPTLLCGVHRHKYLNFADEVKVNTSPSL